MKSNKESGNGYSDIQVEIEDEKIGIVIEVRYAQNSEMDTICQEALTQIKQKGYADELYESGVETVIKYGIACCRKKCRVVVEI